MVGVVDGSRLRLRYLLRPGTESETAPIREISVYSAAETPAVVPGPVTEDGLGIGAARAEVLAAYPDAQDGVSTMGSDTWLMLPSATDAHVFFAFRENSDTAWDVTVTTGAEPPTRSAADPRAGARRRSR